MASNSNSIRIYLRISLIVVMLLGFSFSLAQDKWYVTSGAFLLAAIVLSVELATYTRKHLRELQNLLEAIRQNAYNDQYVPESNDPLYRSAFAGILEEMKNARIEKQSHYEYLQQVISHARVAMICFDEKQQIDLFNAEAEQLLGMSKPDNLRQLNRAGSGLEELMLRLRESGKEHYRLNRGGMPVPLVLYAGRFRILQKEYCLVSLHDIKSEMEAQETESWKKLIRVLTHEIMNSVTPVKSLTSALRQNIEKHPDTVKNSEEGAEIAEGLQIIEERSNGLLRFVDLYRSITRLPEPEWTEFKVHDILKNIVVLMKPGLEASNIGLEISYDAKIPMLVADYDMIQQVLINLLQNASEALAGQENAQIKLHAGSRKGRAFISVIDNGPGVRSEDEEMIFIPFFTTRKNGNGIGLSLSRQIMQLHKGSLSFENLPQAGARFVLQF